MPAPRRSLPLLLLAGLLTACGSTVQVSSTGVVGGGQQATTGGDGLGQPGGPTAPVDGSTGAVLAPGATTGGTSGTSTGPGAAPGTTGGSTTGVAAPVGLSGPGVTAKEVRVGIIYDPNAGAVNEAAGVGAITSGDSKANAEAIIKDINARGGVGGRKLVPVYGDFDSTSTQTLDQQDAALCERFTKDEPVFAVLSALRNPYRECLTKAGVVILSLALPDINAATLARYPGFIEMGHPNIDRLAAHHVTPLVDQGYFTPWNTVTGQPAAAGQVKVGILTYADDVFGPAVDRYLVPAVKRLGFPVQVVKIAQITTASDYGAQAAAVKSAQLTFASNQVTHVLTFESNGGLSTFFLPNARTQGYYPRYGVNSANGSEALLESGIVEPSQFNGAVGYAWIPAVDLRRVDNGENTAWSNANRRYCLKVMRANGIQFDSGNAEAIALSQCAGLYLLQKAAAATPDSLNVRSFVRVVEALGAAYQPAGTIGVEFRPGRRDGANKAYHWRYTAACECFRYVGAPHTVP